MFVLSNRLGENLANELTLKNAQVHIFSCYQTAAGCDNIFHFTIYIMLRFFRWYFGSIGRETANQILNERVDSGTFLVRDSSTMPGEYVLCVRYHPSQCPTLSVCQVPPLSVLCTTLLGGPHSGTTPVSSPHYWCSRYHPSFMSALGTRS